MDYIKVHINDYPRKEVAKAAGVTLHTLYKYITILGGTKIDNKLNNETIRKISDMYKTMTAREISEVTNIPQSTILGQVSKLGLKHNVETINRIRKERNKSLRNYWNKERYARRRTMLSYGMALSVDIIEDFLISLTWWADLGFFHLPSYKITRI